MPFVLLLIGGILIVAAYQNTHGDLINALEHDTPGFVKWGLAIVAVAGLGYVPGLRTISRYMLALVLLVIVLANYKNLLSGFTDLGNLDAIYPAGKPNVDPGTQVALTGGAQTITTASIAGTGGAGTGIGGSVPGGGLLAGLEGGFGGGGPGGFDPGSIIGGLGQEIGGLLGGIV